MLSRRRSPGGRSWILAGLAGACLGGAMSCSTQAYREDADSEVYRIIEEKQEEALGHPLAFSLERPEETARDRIQALLQQHRLETLGQKLIREIEASTPESDEQAAGEEGAEDETGEGETGREGEGETGEEPEPREGEARREGEGPYGGRARPPGAEAPVEDEPDETGVGLQDEEALLPPSEDVDATIQPALLTLTLRECLEVAAENSRPFQGQRERVYLTVLSLTLQRWNFSIQQFGFLSGQWIYAGKDSEGNDIQQVTVDPDYTLTKRFEQGASVAVSLGASLLRTITGGGDDTDISLLSLSMTQPLLRGAGWVASEPLTQSEREAIYAIRDFERFKKSLAVQITSDYYRVLQGIDQVDNERRNLQQLNLSLARSEALAEAGRLPEFEVDQTRQQVLSARDRLIQSRVSYQNSLDQFKVTLGLPPDAPVDLDRGELEALPDPSDEPIEISEDHAVRIALRRRLDLQNTRDVVDDAERQVLVAVDALDAELNLTGSANVVSRRNRLSELRFDEGSYRAGFDLDLPLDRTPERNAYRSSLIALQAAERDAILQADQIGLDIRDSLRSLERARESITIRRNAVELARRRVESTRLLLEAGRVTSRDLLESQQALVDSENSLIAARVDYFVNQLQLLQDLELLSVEPGGLNIQNDLEELESLTDVNAD